MNKLVKQLTADKKRLSIMLGLLCVGLLLWGRLLLKQIPKTAIAKPSAELVAALDKIEAAQHTTPEGDEIRRPVVYLDLGASGEGVSGRDLFAWNPSGYPRSRNWNPSQEKSPSDATDESLQNEELARAKAALVLQTTMLLPGTGAGQDKPRAMINGQLLVPGQRVGEFVLKQVLDRKVILEYRPQSLDPAAEGLQVRLEMQ